MWNLERLASHTDIAEQQYIDIDDTWPIAKCWTSANLHLDGLGQAKHIGGLKACSCVTCHVEERGLIVEADWLGLVHTGYGPDVQVKGQRGYRSFEVAQSLTQIRPESEEHIHLLHQLSSHDGVCDSADTPHLLDVVHAHDIGAPLDGEGYRGGGRL